MSTQPALIGGTLGQVTGVLVTIGVENRKAIVTIPESVDGTVGGYDVGRKEELI